MAGPLKTLTQKHKIKGKIVVVAAQWHEDIIDALCQSACAALLHAGIKKSNIITVKTPGSFELPLAALCAARQKNVAGVVCLGCLIEGETPHFHYIAQAVAQGLMDVSLSTQKPVGFGVLTARDKKQAQDRAGGKWGNKGEEAAAAVLEMARLGDVRF